MTTHEDRSIEVREEIIQENQPGFGDELGISVDRRERVEVVRDAGGERRERIVEDYGSERRMLLAKVARFIYLLTGMLQLGLGLRILLKLIAANPSNPFARLVYGVTELFVWPFQGLTVTPMAENGMILEINTFFAMLVYTVAAWGVVQIMYLIFSPATARSISVYHQDRR
ncbi:MAG: YggT family protein [Anaerolineae bacterium]|nr:YggT family protein [Anaerolineae bacterium]